MAMKLKEFDFKGFLLEKGERVGLYAAGGIALFMVILSLFLPGKGLLSPSPKKQADEISNLAGTKKNAVATARPNATEEEELRKVPGELQKQASSVAEDPEEFRLVHELFAPREIPSPKRQNPTIYGPEEFAAQVMTAQISSYMIKYDRDAVWVGILEGSGRPDVKGKGNPLGRIGDFYGNKGGGPGGKPGGPGGMPGFPGGYGPGGQRGGSFGGPPGMGDKPGAFGDGGKNLAVNYVRKDELSGKNPVFARDLLPLPMAYIVGAFPLRKEIDEFKTALRAESAYNVVFQDTVGDKDKIKPAFHFLGFVVQRKTYGPDGKVILGSDGKPWQDLDLQTPNSLYVGTVARVLREFTPEDPKIAPLLIPNLYLPLPVQIPAKPGDTAGKPYDNIEKDLPKIQQTLAKMKEKDPAPAVASSKFDEGTFNPFGEPDDAAKTPAGSGAPPKVEDWAPPEYAVIRFLDLTIQPGQTYEYQVKVKMLNPNWNKPESEVANKQLTKMKELESEWVPVAKPNGEMVRVSVSTDLYLYAVDEQEDKPKDYKGMNAKATYDASRQVPMQIHKWMPAYEVSGSSTTFYPVGDWVVGERIFATRGELVGVKKVQTHVPIWSPESSQFILAGRPVGRPRMGVDVRPTEPVGFIEARKAPLLVDFDGGTITYRRGGAPVPKTEDGTAPEGTKPTPTTEVRYSAGTEVLLLRPDGKLEGRVSAHDKEDKERIKREEEYSRRVAETEGKEIPAGGGKPGDPFGGGPKPMQ